VTLQQETTWSNLRPLLIYELKVLRRRGLRRLAGDVENYPVLTEVATKLTAEEPVGAIEALLRQARTQMQESPAGQAVAYLYGLEAGLRGRTPTDLRRLAADRLGYAEVETFRKKPENEAIATLADTIYSLVVQDRMLSRNNGSSLERVEAIVAAIEGLTTLELAELARRLKATLFVP
jgi:hypothetical protein